MLIKGVPQHVSRLTFSLLAGLLGLLIGIVCSGSLRAWLGLDALSGEDASQSVESSLGGSDNRLGKKPATGPPGDLSRLQIVITDSGWKLLARARDRALERGMIVTTKQDAVPVQVSIGDEAASGVVRLKGDWLDHVKTDQWSLRFEMDTAIRGMRRFSIQHPLTRGFVMEWLVMKTAQREGVLAPRSDYVQVSINGVAKGVYYLEEHFSKELLEAQGRREGPIVRFDEGAMWATWLQHGFHKTNRLSSELTMAGSFFVAEVSGYGEGALQRSKSLDARLQRALTQARDLQRLAVSSLRVFPSRAEQALTQLEGSTIDDLFVVDRLGQWLALYTLFRGFHGLAWHQYRFYHDPVLDRLEPIVFDTGANLLLHVGELALSSDDARWFASSDAVMAAAFEELGRMTEPGWVEDLIQDLRPRLSQIVAAMTEAKMVVPGVDFEQVLEVMLPKQVESLRKIVRPVSIAGFAASHVGVRLPSGEDTRTVDVDAWATTAIPTQVTGFRFGNGRVVSAEQSLVGLVGDPDSAESVTTRADGSVVLPRDGKLVRFRFPTDYRLADLREIQAIKRAIRSGIDPGDDGRIKVSVMFRTLAEEGDRVEPMTVRRSPDPGMPRKGRPAAPTLTEVLEKHGFLHYDLDTHMLSIGAGRHEVVGDLVLPDHMMLHISAGADLMFDEGRVLLCAGIAVEGTEAQPVRMLAKDSARGFGGLLVIGGADPSVLRHFEIQHATAIERGGWQSSGAVTFYRAPVSFYDCKFMYANCEDAVNVFAARVHFERCSFDGGPHDLFDGDFVFGEILDCRFQRSGEDAIDVSGSQIVIKNCMFEAIGDKALSIGEKSDVTAQSCRIRSASIGAAVKDRSKLIVRDLVVSEIENFVFAAYIKKPEFGPSQLMATGLEWSGIGDPQHLSQTGCTVSVNGSAIVERDVDVESLYRQKILGK